jgi:exopolysaccharide transport family protein
LEAPTERGDELKLLIATVRRRARVLVSVAAVVIAAVVIVTFQQTPLYTATASVMIDTRKHDVSNIEEVMSGLPADSGAVDTEVEILESRTLAERVVDALGLDRDPEFNGQLSRPGQVQSLFGAPTGFVHGVVTGGGDPASSGETARETDIRRATAHDAVVDQVLSRLSVKRSGTTYVIDIGFESRDPGKAALIANTFADKYLLEQLEAKYEATQQATQWLNQRLAQLQPQVEAAEAAVQQYKAQHGLLASVGSSLTEQEISNLNTELDQAKADEAEKDARVRTAQQEAQTGSTNENLTGPLSSATMMQLRAQQAAASSKVADLETKYGPKHPEVQRAQRELVDINAQISQEVGRDVSNLQTEDDVARQRVASLEASLSGAKGTLIGNNAASVELADLQRRADAASTLYDSLLTRAKQTSVDQGGEQSDARVLSHAKIPLGPSYPKKGLNLALGIVLGLACGAGSVFLMEALDSGLSTSEDIERYLGLPFLGSVPLLESTVRGKLKATVSPREYLLGKPLSAFSESFRNLRASILFSKVDTPVKVIAFTSALPSEGKTTTTICLGGSMAMAGGKVVVVDCDLRRRSISKSLDEPREFGLIEVLQGIAKLDDVLIRDDASDTWFLPLAESPYTPKDLFGSVAMDRLIDELRQRFDYVLLDTAPVIPVSDTRMLAPKADVVVFLARWRKTPRKAIDNALTLLTSVGADVAGVALTLVDVRSQAKHGYGDAGYYYNHYRKYYAQ